MILGIKKYAEKLLLPLARKITKVPANLITLIGLIFAFISFFALIYNYLILAIIFLIFTEIFDQLDGTVAKLQGPTKFGGFLDSFLDRLGDFLIFLGIFLGGYITLNLFLISFICAFLTSYSRAKIESLGDFSLYNVGIIERTDRIPILIIGSIFQIWFLNALYWTIIVLTVGSIITIIQRIYFAYSKLANKEKE
jgi:phosphatidylglycerophosphate synthase